MDFGRSEESEKQMFKKNCVMCKWIRAKWRKEKMANFEKEVKCLWPESATQVKWINKIMKNWNGREKKIVWNEEFFFFIFLQRQKKKSGTKIFERKLQHLEKSGVLFWCDEVIGHLSWAASIREGKEDKKKKKNHRRHHVYKEDPCWHQKINIENSRQQKRHGVSIETFENHIR